MEDVFVYSEISGWPSDYYELQVKSTTHGSEVAKRVQTVSLEKNTHGKETSTYWSLNDEQIQASEKRNLHI